MAYKIYYLNFFLNFFAQSEVDIKHACWLLLIWDQPGRNFRNMNNYTYYYFILQKCQYFSLTILLLQIKGKESENSYQELRRSQKGQAHTKTESRYFDWHGHLPQSKESKCLWTHDKDGVTGEFMKGATRGLREGWIEGNNYKHILSSDW